eukprot:SAG31_NODE_2176_length_6256_cov_1.835797_4_plen_320_part_00
MARDARAPPPPHTHALRARMPPLLITLFMLSVLPPHVDSAIGALSSIDNLWQETAPAHSSTVPALHPRVQLVGRWRRNPTLGSADHDHPGTEIRLRVSSGTTGVSLNLKQQHNCTGRYGSSYQPNYYVVLVDGVVQPGFANATFSTAFVSNVSTTTVSIARGLNSAMAHDIRVFKSSEAQWASDVPTPNFVTLLSIELHGTAAQLLEPAPLPQRQIEFLGDIITAGYCNILWVADIDRHHTNRSNLESFWLSWPTRICESLGASCNTAAWSGYALIKSKFCGKPVTMPEIYNRTLATVAVADWRSTTIRGSHLDELGMF